MTPTQWAFHFVDHSRRSLDRIRFKYEESLAKKEIDPDLQVDIKNLLENLRSALDYVAGEVFALHGVKNSKKKPFFPVAEAGWTANQFRTRTKEAIPGLMENRPDIVNVLESYQKFAGPNNGWLPQFVALNNKDKHWTLTPQECIDTKVMRIRTGNITYEGSGLVVSPGAKFTIDGKEITPGVYGPNNLPNVPPTATAEVTIWTSFHFTSPDVEVLSFLSEAINGVRAIITHVSNIK